ncbi:Ig-like domain-containing protein [Fictibacillus aquaticus]|uniref:Bacterial Ig domain-containing protein n=1 Tax=Fictibacillus aquaticus TaxID=2021314 RepID=A0A235F8Q6_9BACL|nr:Ig-like domain-containing protein [Fictibacillus aquaticus]OYD57589.1 hypothetical protein CGZ90_13050 [Fictibacillus aquaticus]
MKKVLLTGLFASLLAASVPANVSAADFKSDTKVSSYIKSKIQQMESRDEDGFLIETEPNDTLSQANVIPGFEPIRGDFHSAQDMDYYKFTVPKNYSKLALAGYTIPDGNIELAFELLDKNGKTVQPYKIESDDIETAQFYNISAGTYYVMTLELDGQISQTELDDYALMAFPIDTTPPDAPTVNTVDDNDKRITGVAEPGTYVSVRSGSKEVGQAIASRTGGYTIPLKASIKAGTALAVTATDDRGHDSKAKRVVVKDGTAPGTPKVNAVDSNDKKVTGTAEANAAITVKVGSKVIATGRANSKGKFIVTVKAQRKGTVLYVAAADKAKNVSKSARVVVKKG